MLSLHINNIYAKKKGVPKKLILTLRAIMISQEVDLVAGDFNGTAWRCRSRDNLSADDEAFMDSILPAPPDPTPLWRPGSISDNWADVYGFLKPPGSQRFWKVNKHGAFSIPRTSLGVRPTDQSCHHETWLHLDFVDWSKTWSRQNTYEPHILVNERPADGAYGNPQRKISEVMSDHSLSSYYCDRSLHGNVGKKKKSLCSEQDHPEFPLQDEGQSRGAESVKRGPVSTRKTGRSHDLRRLSSDWR